LINIEYFVKVQISFVKYKGYEINKDKKKAFALLKL